MITMMAPTPSTRTAMPEVWRHVEMTLDKQESMGCEPTRGCLATMSRLCRIDTIRFAAAASFCVTRHRIAVPKKMSRKSIEALPSGHYWAVPHAPFPLDDSNGHNEVFPGAHFVSDGKWVIFYKNGQEIWVCNAVYAAAHFDFSAVSSA